MLDYGLIGKRIKEMRRRQHISQAKLAEMSDLSISYIARVEKGDKKPSLSSIIRIVNSLGITTDELLYGNQTNDPSEYHKDFDLILSDCSSLEKKVLYEALLSFKKILRENFTKI